MKYRLLFLSLAFLLSAISLQGASADLGKSADRKAAGTHQRAVEERPMKSDLISYQPSDPNEVTLHEKAAKDKSHERTDKIKGGSKKNTLHHLPPPDGSQKPWSILGFVSFGLAMLGFLVAMIPFIFGVFFGGIIFALICWSAGFSIGIASLFETEKRRLFATLGIIFNFIPLAFIFISFIFFILLWGY